MNVAAERIRQQIAAILSACGMDTDLVRSAAEVMVETNLAGIDSHGISMLMLYEEVQRAVSKQQGHEVHCAP